MPGRMNPASGRTLSRFAGDTRGDVAILFGLMTLVLCTMIGLAVDYGRLVNARSQTLEATDAAVLAGARALQTNGGDQAAAVKVAQAYYKQAVQIRIQVIQSIPSTSPSPTMRRPVVSNGNAAIATPFMSFGRREDAAASPRQWVRLCQGGSCRRRQCRAQSRSQHDARHHRVDGRARS